MRRMSDTLQVGPLLLYSEQITPRKRPSYFELSYITLARDPPQPSACSVARITSTRRTVLPVYDYK
jgi:hypothetical protein